jgi:phenylalanyl-tRNA synthetase beta chain
MWRCSRCPASTKMTRPEGQRRVAGGIRRGTARDHTVRRPSLGWCRKARGCVRRKGRCYCRAGSLRCAGRSPLLRARERPAWYHPGRSGLIKLGPKTVLGHFGEFHPNTLDALDVSGPLCGFEVFIDAIPEAQAQGNPHQAGAWSCLSLPGCPPRLCLRGGFCNVPGRHAGPRGAGGRQAVDHRRQCLRPVRRVRRWARARNRLAIEIIIQPRERTLTDEDLDKSGEIGYRQCREIVGRRA